jgi:hypothetical protein
MQMTYLAAAAALLSLIVLLPAHADDLSPGAQLSAPSIADIRTVLPALERYSAQRVVAIPSRRPAVDDLSKGLREEQCPDFSLAGCH